MQLWICSLVTISRAVLVGTKCRKHRVPTIYLTNKLLNIFFFVTRSQVSCGSDDNNLFILSV